MKNECETCDGLTMVPDNTPDGDVMNTPCPDCNNNPPIKIAKLVAGSKQTLDFVTQYQNPASDHESTRNQYVDWLSKEIERILDRD